MTTEVALLSDDDVLEGHVGPGDLLDGKYRIERLLCYGGMSSVYLGEHVRIRRRVAIKLLHQSELLPEECIRRFEDEAQIAGRIGSPHIVEVLDAGIAPGGDLFLVMEHLEGETLKERLERGPIKARAASRIARQLLEALADAHEAGVIHLDLKPGNVFLVRPKRGGDELVKILDFGIARCTTGAAQPAASTVLGTAHYMSPEQAVAAEKVDARSDLYAVGVILYRAVTGRVPFSGTPVDKVLRRVVFERPPHPCRIVPELDERFAAIVMKAMERDPEARHRTALELAGALLAWENDEPEDRATVSEGLRPAAAASASAPASAPVSARAPASAPASAPAPAPAPASVSTPAPAPASVSTPPTSWGTPSTAAPTLRRRRSALSSRELLVVAGVAAGALVFAATTAFDRAAGLTTAAATTAVQPIAGRSLDLARAVADAASSAAAIVPASPIAPPPRAPKRARPPRLDDRQMPSAPVSTAAEPVRAASARVVDDYGY